MAITIRRAVAAEAGDAARLWLRARQAAADVIPAPAHTHDEVLSWFEGHVVPRCELWLAEDGAGKIAGLLVLDDEWVSQLYVAPELCGPRDRQPAADVRQARATGWSAPVDVRGERRSAPLLRAQRLRRGRP
jgi:hypothetical protein